MVKYVMVQAEGILKLGWDKGGGNTLGSSDNFIRQLVTKGLVSYVYEKGYYIFGRHTVNKGTLRKILKKKLQEV